MRSLKVLLLAVVLPGILSVIFFGSLMSERSRHAHDHHVVSVRVAEPARVGARVVEVRARDARAREARVRAEVRAREARVRAMEARARALASVAEIDAEALAREIEAEVAAATAHLDVSSQARCAHRSEHVTRVNAAEVARLVVEAGSGFLRVQGRPDLDEVVVRATLCASSEDLLGGLGAHTGTAGDAARVRTEYPRMRGYRNNQYARIDLTIDVPLGLAAELDDGSGEIYVSGTGDTRISDGSGEIEARGVNGALTIEDGSGEMELVDIGGDVEIVDGSGELSLRDIDGEVTLTDASGSIDVIDVSGSVHVRADGSGSIDVAEVEGDFIVDADGSGSISHSRVDGRVSVPRRHR